MIGRVTGKLVYKQPPRLLIDIGGIGYELEAPMTAFYDLPESGGDVSLHTHMVVRDDAHLLFGFSEMRQRDLFRSLLKVSGVGPRVALAILSGLTADDLVACVNAGDAATLTRVPGIGRKTAERLIVEMRDRLKEWQAPAPSLLSGTTPLVPSRDQILAEAEAALVALGYKPQEAGKMLMKVPDTLNTAEELIREALRSSMSR